MFTEAEFLLSASSPEHFPKLLNLQGAPIPEIAFVGRSNVGKSSLINHLTQKKNLARISSTPGKTQLINFFAVGQHCTLVDLPGYGFAKVSKSKRIAWGEFIQQYLEERSSLKMIVLLCDLRHPPTQDDIAFANWALHFQKPLMVVFTKADKLSKNQVVTQCEKHFTLLCNQIDGKPVTHLAYSIKAAKGRTAFIKELQNRLN